MIPSQKPEYRKLPVTLTEEERLARGMRAAELGAEYAEVEEAKKAAARDLGQKLKTLRAEMDELHEAVRTGREQQDVQVDHHRNEERKSIETIRLDTGEIIDSRPMTVEERQGSLFAIPGGRRTHDSDADA